MEAYRHVPRRNNKHTQTCAILSLVTGRKQKLASTYSGESVTRRLVTLFLRSGRSIPVVRTIRVRKDRVRFPAARQSFIPAMFFYRGQNCLQVLGP